MTFGILLFEFCAIYLFVQYISPLVIYWLFNISPLFDIDMRMYIHTECVRECVFIPFYSFIQNVYSYWMFIHTECVFILFIHSYRGNVYSLFTEGMYLRHSCGLIGGGMYHFLYACVYICTLTKERFQALPVGTSNWYLK